MAYRPVAEDQSSGQTGTVSLPLKKIEINDHLARQDDHSYMLNDVFANFVKSEHEKVKAGRKRIGLLRTDLNCLTHVLNHLGEHLISQIDDDVVAFYQGQRRNEGVKPVTINTEVRKLRLMLKWCFRKRMIDQMPVITDLVEPPVQTEVPTLHELLSILEHLPFRHRVLTRLMCETGLRVSEAMGLRWKQVDLVRLVIKIGDTTEMTPKTAHSHREVMIGEGLAQDLIALGQEHAHVFPGFRDPSIPMDNYRKALKTAVKKSGVMRYGEPMRFTPKFGRKAFTSYQWLRCIPLELIRKTVGHSPNSRVTEKNYLHMPAESARDAVLVLNVLAEKAK
ncbi:tyrosine-type recombinase/integrase [Lentibacter algarum]|uniref:tyrosine-type recombinase/integrase n=1 Tax=Lentibacter algarum TaxID=576131 RepID=UPI001C08D642|nr:tyrosine-type recombinase/integrase [Lentibacter algarum]MBU2983264.1 tyrosine-type recombinase/integrase [Lentibacter algarum]